MANRLVLLLLLVGALGTFGACGKQIGDACNFAQDCSPNGNRICDPDPSSPSGYCTIFGCDYSTCPGEAACVQFFTGDFSNRTCDPAADRDECQTGVDDQGAPLGYPGSLDELCAVSGHCVSRSSEIRYCMLKCSSDGDCRSGYECRTLELMQQHGGQPVLAPGLKVTDKSPRFCAAKPTTST